MEKAQKGDLVRIEVTGIIESENDSGFIVRVHGELVPVMKSQVTAILSRDPQAKEGQA